MNHGKIDFTKTVPYVKQGVENVELPPPPGDKIELFNDTLLVQEFQPNGTITVQEVPLTAEARFNNLKSKLKEVRDELAIAAKDYFKEKVNALFAQHPALQSFSWVQYTPYFMDGDVCEFGVQKELVELNGMTEDNETLNYKVYNKNKGYEPKDDDVSRGGYAAENLIGSFADVDMKRMFGDHVQVQATREGITTQEYDHE